MDLGEFNLEKLNEERYLQKLKEAPLGTTIRVYFRTLSHYDVAGTAELRDANEWMKQKLSDLGYERTGLGWLIDMRPAWKDEFGHITGWERLYLFEYKKVK